MGKCSSGEICHTWCHIIFHVIFCWGLLMKHIFTFYWFMFFLPNGTVNFSVKYSDSVMMISSWTSNPLILCWLIMNSNIMWWQRFLFLKLLQEFVMLIKYLFLVNHLFLTPRKDVFWGATISVVNPQGSMKYPNIHLKLTEGSYQDAAMEKITQHSSDGTI